MSSQSIPKQIHLGKSIIDRALNSVSGLLDTTSEALAQKLFKVIPAENIEPDDVPEEVEWLESGRTQLPFRRDTLWAVPQMWWEMAFGAVGAGTFIFSRAAGSKAGMATGLAVGIGGKGLLLLADLGRPERFPKVFSKPSSSWIARGSYAFSAFAVLGGVALFSKRDGVLHRTSGTLADTAALIVTTYDGLFLNEAKAVASWVPRLLPVLFVADAAKTGSSVASAFAKPSETWMRNITTVSALTTAAISAGYVSELKAGSTAARLSARDLTETVQKDRFLIDSLAVGTLVPGLLGLSKSTSRITRATAGAAACIGTVAMRRAVLQAGIHTPVIEPPRRAS